MNISSQKLFESIFLFVIIGASGYLIWRLFSPFIGAIALAAIIVTICYPMYERILHKLPNKSKSLAALISLSVVIILVVLPLAVLASFILTEALSIYALFNSSDHLSIIESLSRFEKVIQAFVPTFSIDTAKIVQQATSFIVNHSVSLFTGTASTIFSFFIAFIASYYFFKDGKYFTTYLIKISPLDDTDDTRIITRLATAVRSVALGTVLVAIIQGSLTALGLTIFGFDRAILWGCIAAIGSLIPGIGTTVVFVPAVAYLLYSGAYLPGFALSLWGIIAVGLIDNLIGPRLMSRGNNMHPFLILLAVLGGISLFGPIGFILGPVILSLFLVLLELYHAHIKSI